MSLRRIALGTLLVVTAFVGAGGCGGGGGRAPLPGGGGLPGGDTSGDLSGVLLLTSNNRPATTEREPNDTLGDPDEIGSILVGQRLTIFGKVDDPDDPVDGFRLRCPQRAVVTVTFTIADAITNDVRIHVYDPTSLQIVETFLVPSAVSQFTFTTRATFDVVVTCLGGGTEYRLDLAVNAVPAALTEREPNDATTQGQYTGVLYPGERLSLLGTAHAAGDPTDVWLVPFPLAASFTFDFTSPAFHQFDVEVLDGTTDVAAPTPLATVSGTGTPVTGTVTIPSGTLVVLRVHAVSGPSVGAWTLTLRPTEAPPGTPKPGPLEGRPRASLDREADRAPGLGARYGRVLHPVRAGEIIVGCADEGRGDASVAAAAGAELARVPGGPRRVRMPLPRDVSTDEAARATLGAALALEGAPGVGYAEPNGLSQPHDVPDDPLFERQWHYDLINLPQAWALQKGSGTVTVAVLDTGITPHPDLDPVLVNGFDFVSDPSMSGDGDGLDPDPFDSILHSSFHGTHVAGTISAATNNGIGVAGVAWGVRIMPVRCLGQGGGTWWDIADAVRYAAGLSNSSGTVPAKRADVINMSLGAAQFDQTIASACAAAYNAGVVIVASSGNSNSPVVGYPAGNFGVIAVGSVNAVGQRAFYSNYGSTLDLVAPGGSPGEDLTGDGFADEVLSTLWDDWSVPGRGIYEYMFGTSMASPHVAGVAALLLSADPTLTPAEVTTLLQATAHDLGSSGFDLETGYGLLDAFAAVSQATGATPPPEAEIDVDFEEVEFGAVDVQRYIPITNFGVSFLNVEAPLIVYDDEDPTGSWLSAMLIGPPTANTNARSILLTVSRAGLAAGGYAAEVHIDSNGGTRVLHVSMVVLPGLPPLPPIPLRLFAKDAQTGAVVRFVDVDANTSYGWGIPGLPVGRYILTAGTDLDLDGSYEDEGEYVGAYPTFDQPQMIQVGVNQTISALRLYVSPRTTVDAFARPR